MKKESIIVLVSAILFFITILLIFIKNYFVYKDFYVLNNIPFQKMSILNENIKLENNKKSYEIEVDCSSLKDENIQIVYYDLKKDYQDYKVSVKSQMFDKEEQIVNSPEDIYSIEFNINIKDSQNKSEQIYQINALCK